jgi:signal transduction histidine kinase
MESLPLPLSTAPRRIARRVIGVAAAWSTLVVLFALQDFFSARSRGRYPTTGPFLLRHALGWAAWALLTPAIVMLARRFPVRGPNAIRNVVAHLGLGISASAIQSFMLAAVFPLFYYYPSLAALRDVFWDRIYSALTLGLLVYASIVAATHAVDHSREVRRREIDRAQVETRAVRAELGMLHLQLQPHFLFNTLNSLVELVDADPRRATQMIRDLSELLRQSLASVGSPRSTLRAELALVERYVAIQRIRFQQLQVGVDVDDDALDASVPSFVLQPLVENAIRYSVGVRGHGNIAVRAQRDGGRLRLTVTDDGVGLDGGAAHAGIGTGLANVRARLRHLYGDDFALDLRDCETGGVEATIVLPATDSSPPQLSSRRREGPAGT